MSDNARRVVFFEEWMDTKSAIETFDAVEDVQVQRLEYAGDSMSGSFEIFANKEVHVGGEYIGGYATEATENFSLKITEINGKATYDEAFEVEIKDYTALTPEPETSRV